MGFFDLQIPFFVPVWRRLLLIVICLGWAGFEFLSGAPLWALVFSALGLFAAWQLFFAGWPNAGSTNSDS